MLYFRDNKGKEYRAYAKYDDIPESPRENRDNLATMYLYWPHMLIGDTPSLNARQVLDNIHELINDIDEDADTEMMDFKESVEYLNTHDYVADVVYGYEHSGFTISISGGYPYNDRWDGGICGITFISKEKVQAEFGKDVDWREKGEEIIKSEVKEYDLYLRGEAYSLVIEKRLDYEDNYRDDDDSYEEYEEFCGYLIDLPQKEMEEKMLDDVSPELFDEIRDVEYREGTIY